MFIRMIIGDNIVLNPFLLDHISDDYLSWMNDYEVVKYTESRYATHTPESLKEFVSSSIKKEFLFAICDKVTMKHIGNIKIGNLHPIYKYADIGLIIGDKMFWGKGVASEAIKLCVDFAFSELKLHRLTAGIYTLNIGSIKAFEKAGFICEGIERKKYIFEGEWIDSCIYGIVNENTK